ncbi:MAG: hypothetical protein AD742_05590 [Methylibium sp. NZG]|nr:MAG: hypothetical protein AD742_05590 [Methylibium sp. NZG]
MDMVNSTLRGPPGNAPRKLRGGPGTLLIGGGGALGSAVLEKMLGTGRLAPLRVLVAQAFKGTVRGLEPLPAPDFEDRALASPATARSAVVVFDRARHANGREDAYLRAEPQALPVLARWLRCQGVRHLVVVMPHSPAGLPHALRHGLANLDEQAVAEIGFEHLVFVRTAQPPGDPRADAWLQRVADGLLMQLRLMIPAAHQPVRATKVAQFVAELAAQLPASPVGSRVAPPELVWQAAQQDDAAPLVTAWLAGSELPPLMAPRQRL